MVVVISLQLLVLFSIILEKSVEDVLSDFGISINTMISMVEERLIKIAENVCSKHHDDYSWCLLMSGVGRFQELGIMAEGSYPFEKLIALDAILGDDFYLNPFGHDDAN